VKKLLTLLEVPLLLAVPLTLIVCAFFQVTQTALLTLLVTSIVLVLFCTGFEMSRPPLRQIMPTIVLAALAAAGRILFVMVPNFKPVSAICIVAGVVFGRRTGFMVGALAALISNFFFGHGPWTPWQMYAWGTVGYLAGLFAEHELFKHTVVLYLYGFVSAFLYGLLLNTWYIVGFIHPLTWQSALIAYGASLPFDLLQGIATVIFLLLIFAPWQRKLKRIKTKYELIA